VNHIGTATLTIKELRRFSKVWMQTVFSPLITTSLYFLVFGVALGSRLSEIEGVPYILFVVPGLMMLAMISNSFLNTSSSLFQSKINGTVIDILSAPVGTGEILIAYVSAGMCRGLIVGSLVLVVATMFTGWHMERPLVALSFALMVTASFAFWGLVAAVWAEKFDQLSIFPNFVLTPLTFLGGVFYAVNMLPEPWQTVSRMNPVLYMVGGLRHGMLGGAEVNLGLCYAVVALTLVVSWFAAWVLLSRGYKLRN